jgi:hypothetical protein
MFAEDRDCLLQNDSVAPGIVKDFVRQRQEGETDAGV